MMRNSIKGVSIACLLFVASTLTTNFNSSALAQGSSQQGTSTPRQRSNQQPQLREGETNRDAAISRSQARLARQIRSELLSLPYYDVFDWLEFETRPDGTVVLRGQVVAPPDTKSAAEAAVKDVEGVARVINEIEVLPLSPNDERLRVALFYALFNQGSPLFKYGLGAQPSIHLIVKNGRATLKGIVANEADKNLANIRARGVSGLFEVTNELQVERSGDR